jgi:hypothetical protein
MTATIYLPVARVADCQPKPLQTHPEGQAYLDPSRTTQEHRPAASDVLEFRECAQRHRANTPELALPNFRPSLMCFARAATTRTLEFHVAALLLDTCRLNTGSTHLIRSVVEQLRKCSFDPSASLPPLTVLG